MVADECNIERRMLKHLGEVQLLFCRHCFSIQEFAHGRCISMGEMSEMPGQIRGKAILTKRGDLRNPV